MQKLNYPILMADIIHSRKLNSVDLMTDFKRIIKDVNVKWAQEIQSPLTITLGDEFQGILSTVEVACRIIFDIEEELIKSNQAFKLRYVLNVGKIDTPLNKERAHEMLGEGLTIAREKLNELKTDKTRFHFIIPKYAEGEKMLNDLFVLYGSYVDKWKRSEYPIVKEFLLDKNYQEVAKIVKVNPSSAWRRQKSLSIEEYATCKQLILNLHTILHV